ncbi:ABC transporter permease [Microbacterium sp. LWH7-1.2]|jgi:ribose/xylose/arabinose/galactoside ABC-type transport system permease subunit|uniref:ABC transporter permease n=1 Tax=Microbacterium sp. LWH7-1.2 TaxID=3135257 RepID=UPI0031394FAD
MHTATNVEPAPTATRRGVSGLLRQQDTALLLVLLLLIVAFSLASPYFFSARNLSNVLLSASIIGTMSAVATLVVVSGALDLSIGSIVALTSVSAALLTYDLQWPPGLAILAALVIGALAGALNGVLVTVLRINPIIATIGTLSVFRGLAFVFSNGRDIPVLDPISDYLGFERILGIPVSVLIMIAVFIVTWWVAKYTPWGRNVYAVGANPRAARLAGVGVGGIRMGVLVASGLVAAIAGILLNGQAGSATPSAGVGYELQVLTAVLLGGASLTGGEGRVTRTFIGVLIISVINNGMTLLSVPSYYQTIANGALLLVAVAIDQFRTKAGYR